MKKIVLLFGALALLATSCKKDDETTATSKGSPNEVKYKVTFKGKWTQDLHELATDFPSNAHFSPPVGAVHKLGYKLYELDKVASSGMEIMAETGATGTLINEIDQEQTLVKSSFKSAASVSGGTGTVSWEINVDKDFHVVSLVSMIAPSPDWFVGTKEISLYNNNTWGENITVDALLYDAGSDSGNKFNSTDVDTNPKDAITLMDSSIFKPSGQVSGNTLSGLVLGEWKFELLP